MFIEISFRSLKKLKCIFGDQRVGGVVYGQLCLIIFNFPALGVIIGVRNNFVLPAQCYSTLRIYIQNTPPKLNGLKHCPFLGRIR
jgi:hypothetical protein